MGGISSGSGFSPNPTLCYTNDFAGAQVATTIITPTAGKSIEVKGVYVSSNVVNVDVTIAFAGGAIAFKLYTANIASETGNLICAKGAVDEVLEITCGAGTFVSVGYDEL